MTPTWEAYSEGCKRFNVENLYADEASYNLAYGIQTVIEPIIQQPKAINRLITKPPRVAKPKKPPRVRQPTRTAEEARAHKIKAIYMIREERKAKGLTVRGTVRKVKVEKTIEEIRAERAAYMKEYRKKL